MRITNIKVIITEKDLHSIVNDVFSTYISMPELKIEKILIDKEIYIFGRYTKKISIPFELQMSLIEVTDNTLSLSIDRIVIKKLKIINRIKSLALKKIMNRFNDIGLFVVDDRIKINFEKLCTIIPMVNFTLRDLRVIPYGLEAEVSDFNLVDEKLSKEKDNKIEVEDEAKKENEQFHEEELENEDVKSKLKNDNFELTTEGYSKYRKKLIEKLPNKYKNVQRYVVLIPDILALLLRLYKDNRVHKEIKINISIALVYLLCPIDILPDVVPFLGTIDDVAVTFFILQRVLCDIPEDVILDNWEGEEDIIKVSKDAVDFLSNIVGVNKLKKLFKVLTVVLTKGYKFFLK